jgi:ABC-type Mn2+/Zn2+ transport system ATPase subunit
MATHDLPGILHRVDSMLLLNRTVIAHGRPAEVLSEERLHQLYGGRPMLLPVGDHYVAVAAPAHHHRHPDTGPQPPAHWP